jgi:hypothetical protein
VRLRRNLQNTANRPIFMPRCEINGLMIILTADSQPRSRVEQKLRPAKETLRARHKLAWWAVSEGGSGTEAAGWSCVGDWRRRKLRREYGLRGRSSRHCSSV